MTTTEIQTEALSRARGGMSLMNYAPIIEGFMEKGIAAAEIEPRVNVFTFHAWKALGRIVRKGEHGVKVVSWVPMTTKDLETGAVENTWKRPRATTVFHISQTDPIEEKVVAS